MQPAGLPQPHLSTSTADDCTGCSTRSRSGSWMPAHTVAPCPMVTAGAGKGLAGRLGEMSTAAREWRSEAGTCGQARRSRRGAGLGRGQEGRPEGTPAQDPTFHTLEPG